MRNSSVTLALWSLLVFPVTGRGECVDPEKIVPGVNEYTNEFYFGASSTDGAPGEVVGLDLSLTIQQFHPDFLNGAALVAAYNPGLAELLGEPVYAEDFWEFGGPPFFFELAEVEGLKGFLIVLPTTIHADSNRNKFLGIPIKIGTVYFRLHGSPGSTLELKFLDDVLGGALNQCVRSLIHYRDRVTHRGKFTAYSTKHVAGLVPIVDREPIRTEPPPLPPNAKVYSEPLTDQTAGVRYELSAGLAKPGDSVPVDFFITSNYEFVGYLMAGKFPTADLTLERIEVLTTQGVQRLDNDKGEFGLYCSNSRRRMGAEGERVHAARLYFLVKEAARDLKEVRISLEDHTVGTDEYFVNRLGILQTDQMTHIPAKVEVSPLILAEAVLKLRGIMAVLGDANFDNQMDISDPLAVISFLFTGGPAPECPIAADFSLDGRLNITDPISMLSTLFLDVPGGGEPREAPCR